MLIAEVSTDVPKQFAEWMACLAFAVFFANEMIKLVKTSRGKPSSPPNEQLEATYNELCRRVETVETDVKKDRNDNEVHISARSSKIYEEIKQVTNSLRMEMQTQSDRREAQIDGLSDEVKTLSKEVAGLSSAYEIQTQQIATTNVDVKQILQRLPRLGRNQND